MYFPRCLTSEEVQTSGSSVAAQQMPVASQARRQYVEPALKTAAGNLRPAKKGPPARAASQQGRENLSVPKTPSFKPSPEHATEPTTDDSFDLKKLVDRFRLDEPQARSEREFRKPNFWWLEDEEKPSTPWNANEETHREPGIPAYIHASPMSDRSDKDLDEPVATTRIRTFSDHSSEIGQVSSEGVGSTASAATISASTVSTFRPAIDERPARPIFTRITDSKLGYGIDRREDDILYQWRLRRRLEQAQHGEPITFPSKSTSYSHVSPVRLNFPSVPIEIRPLPQSASATSGKSSSILEKNREEHRVRSPVTSIPTRQAKDMSTQTFQDASIQTSPIHGNDPSPTEHNAVSIHRRPASSSFELERNRKSAITRRPNRFDPIRSVEPSVREDRSHALQSSQGSAFTHVTSMLADQPRHDRSTASVHSFSASHSVRTSQRRENGTPEKTRHLPADDTMSIDYSKDDMMRMLVQRRDDLLSMFREIDQRLAHMIT